MSKFDVSEVDKLRSFKSNFEKNILANFEAAQEHGGIFGDQIDVVTPEDTRALINSKTFSEQIRENEIDLYISYGGTDVPYASAVHSWDPPINWTKSTTHYHFLSNFFSTRRTSIMEALTGD